MLVTRIFSFPHDVFYPIKGKPHQQSSASVFPLDKSKIFSLVKNSFSVFKHLYKFFFNKKKEMITKANECPRTNTFSTLYHTIPTFNNLEKDVLKTLWEKEKMLVTSIFSLSCNVFYPSQ